MSFASRLLKWHAEHGRHDLPWQQPRTPYRVWVSEIMLQQTQVSTVIPYFERWMASFPSVAELAAAPQDAVMSHWAGLGYYARARNLHRTARTVASEYGGELPDDFDELTALPGIGRSTAGAILAQACGQRWPILDGNVKRVLTRHHAIAGWPGKREVEKQLWALAESLTPQTRLPEYTQAIMDLGATVCRRRKPACESCPVNADCLARKAGNPEAYPERAPRRKRPLRHTRMLLATNADGEILLKRRAPQGVWGGLWSLPEIPDQEPVDDFCRRHLGLAAGPAQTRPRLRHGFTHFELEIEPVAVEVEAGNVVRDSDNDSLWYRPGAPDKPGLPAPVEKLLNSEIP